jgi:hypothetical protein
MTAVAGIISGSTVWLGADSAGVSGYDLHIRADPKVFVTGPYVMGFTDSFRMGQLLRYRLKPPEPDGDDLMAFMCTSFTDAVRDCLKDGGWGLKNDGRESGGMFLVGVSGRLFRVEPDYQVAERADRFTACGCGEDYVLGALHAMGEGGRSPEMRLRAALAAAERFSTGVAGPFTIVRTPEPPPLPMVAAPPPAGWPAGAGHAGLA